MRDHLRRWRNLVGLLRALAAPGPALARSSVALLEEHERLARALADERELGRRLEILSRAAPIARELRRRGVT